MLPRLGHRAVRRGHHQDRSVHLGGAGDHVLHIVRVTWAVDVRVVAVLGLILNVRGIDGDAARFFFRGVVDVLIGLLLRAGCFGQNHRDCCRQRRLAVVNMANRANVHVRLVTLKLLLGHLAILLDL